MTTHYLRVVEGLDILDNVLAPFIVRVLREHYDHDWWWHGVLGTLHPDQRRRLPHGGDTDHLIQWMDPAICLNVIEHHWKDLFSREFRPETLSWVRELHATRNTIAHKGPADIDQAYARHTLDLVRKVVAPIDASAADRVMMLAAQLSRIETPL
ncbi:MAG TPA: Swt1 family HEPN domain-containing protein [Magnetospirillaceae bacterium]|jgi:hypothetical protein